MASILTFTCCSKWNHPNGQALKFLCFRSASFFWQMSTSERRLLRSLVHAVCYSSSLRISRTVTARYSLQERAPSPVISPQ